MGTINISQAKTIPIINNYLKSHNLPIKWNPSGICNGLAIVHAHYTLQGKEDIFFKMLHKISAMSQGDFSQSTVNDSPDEDVDHFISHVVLAYNPEIFDKQYSQRNAFKVFKIDGKPLDSSFVLPLVTSEENWAKIFQDLDLQQGEVLKVGSPNHAISIHRKQGKYVVFDPNYSEGSKIFKNEKDMVTELRTKVFEFRDENMALNLTCIIRSGFQHSSSFEEATPKDYFKQYSDVDATATYTGKTITHATLVAREGDKNLMEICLNQKNNWSAEELKDLAAEAIMKHNPKSFDVIYNKLSSCPDEEKLDVLMTLIYLTYKIGNKKILEQILADDLGQQAFNSLDTKSLLRFATQGGNKELLVNLITKIENDAHNELEDMQEVMSLEDAFEVDTEPMSLEDSLGGEGMEPMSLDDFLDGEDTDLGDALPEQKKTRIVEQILGLIREDSALTMAIKGHSPECLSVLLRQLNKEGYILSPDEQQKYLQVAVNSNNIHMVEKLINNMNPEQVNSIVSKISFSAEQVEKTNGHILKILEKNGAQFSQADQNIIKSKEVQKPSIIELFGIKLVQFIEYVRSKLSFDSILELEDEPVAKSAPHTKTVTNLKTTQQEDLKSQFNLLRQKHKEQDSESELTKEVEKAPNLSL